MEFSDLMIYFTFKTIFVIQTYSSLLKKERYSEAALCGVAIIGVLLYYWYVHFAQNGKSYPPNTGGKSPRGQKS